MKVYGMSMRRSDLASWIEGRTFPTMCAMAQLYLFPDAECRNHWYHEVWEKFHSMRLLKRSNKLPKQSFIYDNSWRINDRFVGDSINWAVGHEYGREPREDVVVDQLRSMMDSYFHWLSTKLSENRVVSPSEVKEKLVELGV